jgi:hypothetical protein
MTVSFFLKLLLNAHTLTDEQIPYCELCQERAQLPWCKKWPIFQEFHRAP